MILAERGVSVSATFLATIVALQFTRLLTTKFLTQVGLIPAKVVVGLVDAPLEASRVLRSAVSVSFCDHFFSLFRLTFPCFLQIWQGFSSNSFALHLAGCRRGRPGRLPFLRLLFGRCHQPLDYSKFRSLLRGSRVILRRGGGLRGSIWPTLQR